MPLETRRQAALKLAQEKKTEYRKRSASGHDGTQVAAKLSQKDIAKDNSRHFAACKIKVNGPRPTLVLRKMNEEPKRAPLRALHPEKAKNTTLSINPTTTKQTANPTPALKPAAAKTTTRGRHQSLSDSTSNPELPLALPPVRRHRSSSLSMYPTKKKILPDVVVQAAVSRAETLRKSGAASPVPVTPTRPLVLVDPDSGKEDPQLCTEYAKDIYRHWLEIERRDTYLIKKEFMTTVFFVRPSHRAILVDWLFQLQPKFRFLNDTMFLCVDILDRVLQVS